MIYRKLFFLLIFATMVNAGNSIESNCNTKDTFLKLFADWHIKYYNVNECSTVEGTCRAARLHRVALICMAKEIGIYENYKPIIDDPSNPLQIRVESQR